MRMRIVVIVALLTLAVAGLAACGSAATPETIIQTVVVQATSMPAPEEAYRMGWVVKLLDSQYWLSTDLYGKKAAQSLGITLSSYSAGGENQIGTEINIVEDLIQQKVDAIVIAPVDSQAIIPAIEEANAANIPVITIDTAADGGKVETFVAIDNVKASAMAGEAAGKLLNGTGNVAIVEGIETTSTGRERHQGFEDALSQYPDIQIVASVPGQWTREGGLKATEDVLTAHPEVNLIWAPGGTMALGCVEAVQELGRAGEVFVLSFDGSADELQAIKDGNLAGAVLQNGEEMGAWGILAAQMILDGKTVPQRIEVPGVWVDSTNVDQYLKPSPPVEDYLNEFPSGGS